MIDFPCALDYTLPMLARIYSCDVIGLVGVIAEVDIAEGLLPTDSMDLTEKILHEDRSRVQFVELHE